ncbi:progesterone receptor [Oncorhynchus keta]|uniref:progesterone receptor n=1 Tax=Oncorhynchus keta TaxID=8018 RepID=UPI00227CC8CC|nr:progesterone receptor [Oncorhynchus keta]
MENEHTADRMDSANTLSPDVTDSSKRVSYLIEKYKDVGFGQPRKFSKEPQSQVCMSSVVRSFGNVGTLCAAPPSSSNNSATFKDCTVRDNASLINKAFYDRSDPVRWTEVRGIEGGKDSTLPQPIPTVTHESLQRAATNMISTPSSTTTTGVCRIIKDEKEPSLIMETPCPDFDLTANIPTLETCYDSERKQQELGFLDDSAMSFPTSAPGQQTLLDCSPNFLVDLNQNEQMSTVPQVRADSRGVPFPTHPGKGMLSFDVMSSNGQGPQQHLMIYKSEMPRWSIQTSPTHSSFWCQSSGVSEDQYPHHGYSSPDGIHTSALLQRSPTYTGYGGVPPQRLCMICGDEASGCHYGVLTCGSCKVFFKRAVEGHHNYLCAGRNDCIVDKMRRKNCPACRLRKCYQAGMMLGGRKLKRFGALKAGPALMFQGALSALGDGLAPALMFQGPLSALGDGQTLASLPCMPGLNELQLSPQIISILESIEPEVVYSGYDNSQPDMPHLLLNSLNRLCDRQLLWIVRWSKSLPGFRSLHINDQMTLIQYSWMNLMVFSLGWRSFQNVTSEYLYFAPDLILSQDRMRRSPIYDLCLAMQFIPQEFTSLQVTKEEFLCMKAIMILNTVPLEGLKSQAQFEEMRQNYIRELTKAIHLKERGMVASSQRFYHLTKLMDAMHEIVKKVNLYCLSTYIQADAMKVEFPEMMSEVISSQLPKVLAGMVKTLLFHAK